MLLSVAWFEAKHRILRLSTLVYFAVFFAFAVLQMCVTGGAFESLPSGFAGSGGKVFANSAYGIATLTGLLSYVGLLVAAPVMGQAVYQDYATHSYPFFFTSRLRPRDYLLGRYLGALLGLLVIFSSIGLGLWVGAHLPFLDKSLVGPNRTAFYLWPYLVLVLPNLLFAGALFLSLAALTRGMRAVYMASVLLVVGFQIASALFSKLENQHLAALVNPFGQSAFRFVTQYWTVAEKNSSLIPLRGAMAENRLLWLFVGALVLLAALLRFRFAQPIEGGGKGAPQVPAELPGARLPALGAVSPSWRWPALLAGTTWVNLRETVKNVYFLVLLFAGLLFMVVATRNLALLYGTTVWPVTGAVMLVVTGDFNLFIFIIITLFSGELVWRERDARMDQLLDATPLPSWLPLVSKVLALVAVQVLLLSVVLLFGLGFQTLKGYHQYELGLYLRELYGVQLLDLALLCVLAIAIQVVVNNKLLGYLGMVVYFLVSAFMGPALGLEHHLYNYGTSPTVTYSDMNGYGHFVQGLVWFRVYWGLGAVLLVLVSRLFWVRGVETWPRVRWRLARARLTKGMALALGAVLLAFAATGAFIFHNTNRLNPYLTSRQTERLQAEYERRYKPFQNEPQPSVTAVRLRADLRPETRGVHWSGSYQLVNRNAVPVSRVFVRIDPEQRPAVRRLALGALQAATEVDTKLGVSTFVLPSPLAAGAETELLFDFDSQPQGFRNEEGVGNRVFANGTFVDNFSLPRIGYVEAVELTDDSARRKNGLQPKERMPDLDDARGAQHNLLDVDWVTFEATLTTAPDQLAIAPGDLVREWTENGRRAFLYRSRGRMLDFYSVLSARYAVQRDRWNDVAIEVFYHPSHRFNVERMVEAVKATLLYGTTNFGPYQHGQVRIVEFPRYFMFAQSFPSTIPFSEAIGFIAHVDPSSDEDLDYPYYVTAHEVAHQWWGHQVIGAGVQGSTLLVESLAQYTALMVMKHRYGNEHMRRFLKYELQGYLRGRGAERKKEVPLLRVENQPYIHYQKGSLVLYALQDAIGEQAVDRALQRFLQEASVKAPPYPTARLLLAELRKETPAEYQDFLTDLFETITLFDNRAVSATAKNLGGDTWEVTLRVSAKKLRASELGVEQEVPMDQLVDVGVLDEKEQPLQLEKRRVHSGLQDFTFTVRGKPAKAGIDPLNLLIDRVPDDNLVRVTEK
ncbi:MAG: M1 family aminopeptidase [Myxococcaceae bacterium]